MSFNNRKDLKISVVCPWFYWGDAVGHSAHDYYRAFRALGYTEVKGIGTRNDFEDMEFEECAGLVDLEKSAWFKESDLVIYHFAIFHEYFEILRRPDRKGRHVVCFHNVTPKELMPKDAWSIIDKSIEQISVFQHADAIWAVSRENAEELGRRGITNVPIIEIPLAVDRPPLSAMASKQRSPVELVYVGRFFPSKGVTDIIEALAQVREMNTIGFLLRLVGNTDFSNQPYIEEIKRRVRHYGLGEHVDFVGKVNESTLMRVYKNAHIFVSASYHEGFCAPVIESLRAGLVPVTYSAGNLRWVAGGFGRTVETGNITSLALMLADTIMQVSEAMNSTEGPILRLDKGLFSLSQFSDEAHTYTKTFEFSTFLARLEHSIMELE